MELKIETKVFPDRIELEETWNDQSFSVQQMLTKQVIDLKDNAVREALISLGWIPPAQGEKLLESLDGIANPLKMMQAEAKENNYELDIKMALRLSSCDTYLKELARGALIAHQADLGKHKVRDAEDNTTAKLHDELRLALKENEELKSFVRHFLSAQNRWKPTWQACGVKAYRVAEIVFYQARQLLDKLDRQAINHDN